jgi:hypothetical protein
MALKLLKTTILGKTSNILTVDCSSDDLDALYSLMEGATEQYEAKSNGGTAAPTPAHMRKFRFYVNDGNHAGFKASFTIPHLKPSKTNVDVENYALQNFDAGFATTLRAQKCGTLYANGI